MLHFLIKYDTIYKSASAECVILFDCVVSANGSKVICSEGTMKVRANQRRWLVAVFLFVFFAALCVGTVFGVRYIRGSSVRSTAFSSSLQADSASQLAAELTEKTGLQDLVCLNMEQIGKYYALPEPILETAAVYTAASDTDIHEIAVFEVRAQQEQAMIQRAIKQRLDACASAYSLLNGSSETEQMYYVDNGSNYVVVIIGLPYEKASQILENS